MRVALTNYTGDRGNWGCQATSRNLLAFLKETFSANPSASIDVIPFPTAHPIDRLSEAAIGEKIHSIYSSARPSQSQLSFIEGLTRERFGSCFDRARHADVIVFQGEGSIGPAASFRTPRVFGLPFLAAHLWRKPVLSLNQTIYFASDQDATCARNLFDSFHLVAVRECASYCFATDAGIRGVTLCPDMAFMEFDRSLAPPAALETSRYFCVSGSAVADLLDPVSFASIIRALAERFGLDPVFLFSRSQDKELFLCLQSRIGAVRSHTLSSKEWPDYRSILPVLRSAQFVIGGRYHTAVSALSQGTPVILIPGNTFKSEGIGPMLGLDIPVFDPSQTEAILGFASRLVANRSHMTLQTRRSVAGLRVLYDRLRDSIMTILRAGQHQPPGFPIRHDRPDPELPCGQLEIRHQEIYRAKNLRRTMPCGLLDIWRLSQLRRGRDFEPSIEATLTNFR